MFIVPITPIHGLSELNSVGKVSAEQGAAQIPFSNFLQDAIANVKETSAVEATDAYNLATGQVDELHNLGINQQKAYLSLQLLQSVRNKVLDSYKEIMNMGV